MVGKLERVSLREVWPHEAKDFTTWLEENIDVLNEATDWCCPPALSRECLTVHFIRSPVQRAVGWLTVTSAIRRTVEEETTVCRELHDIDGVGILLTSDEPRADGRTRVGFPVATSNGAPLCFHRYSG